MEITIIKLIDIENNNDNKWFELCLVRYLHPADHYPARITKLGKYFEKDLDFKDIRFPLQVGDIRKIGKTNSIISISTFGYENKRNIQYTC